MSGYMPLQFTAVSCVPVRFDFTMDVVHSLASRFHTDNICVTLTAGSGVTGHGECVPRSYVTGESLETVFDTLRILSPKFLNRSFSAPDDLVAALRRIGAEAPGAANPSAFCALELAALDCAGRYWNLPVSDIVGLSRHDGPFSYSMIVPLLPEEDLVPLLSHAATFDFSSVKVKVANRDPARRVRMVMDRLGGDPEYRVDTNCAWDRDSAPGFVEDLAALGVVSVEQPLAAQDFVGMAELRRMGHMLITLDESVSGPGDVDAAAAAGACDIVNVRLSKCGGLLRAIDVSDRAGEHGLGIQLGAQVGESCILSAAGAHLAAGTPDFRWREGYFGTHLLTRDLCRADIRFGHAGMVVPPAGPGLGIRIDSDRIAEAAEAYMADAQFERFELFGD